MFHGIISRANKSNQIATAHSEYQQLLRVCAPGILPTTIFDFNSIVCYCSRAVFRDISKNLAPRVIGFKHLGHMLIFDRRISENEAPRVTVCRHVGHMLVFDRQISGSPSLCILTAAGRLLINTSCGTRARNLRIRSPTPCPLGQGGHSVHANIRKAATSKAPWHLQDARRGTSDPSENKPLI